MADEAIYSTFFWNIKGRITLTNFVNILNWPCVIDFCIFYKITFANSLIGCVGLFAAVCLFRVASASKCTVSFQENIE